MQENNSVKQRKYGFELTWAENQNYQGKILVFKTKGAKTDMVFQKQKAKTWFVNMGEFKVRWIDTKDGRVYEKILKEGEVFDVKPLVPVQLEALVAESTVIEAGTMADDEDLFTVIPSTHIGA